MSHLQHSSPSPSKKKYELPLEKATPNLPSPKKQQKNKTTTAADQKTPHRVKRFRLHETKFVENTPSPPTRPRAYCRWDYEKPKASDWERLSNPSRQAGSVGGRKEAGISDSGMGGGCLRIFLEGVLYCAEGSGRGGVGWGRDFWGGGVGERKRKEGRGGRGRGRKKKRKKEEGEEEEVENVIVTFSFEAIGCRFRKSQYLKPKQTLVMTQKFLFPSQQEINAHTYDAGTFTHFTFTTALPAHEIDGSSKLIIRVPKLSTTVLPKHRNH